MMKGTTWIAVAVALFAGIAGARAEETEPLCFLARTGGFDTGISSEPTSVRLMPSGGALEIFHDMVDVATGKRQTTLTCRLHTDCRPPATGQFNLQFRNFLELRLPRAHPMMTTMLRCVGRPSEVVLGTAGGAATTCRVLRVETFTRYCHPDPKGLKKR